MISLTLTHLGKTRPLHFDEDAIVIGRSKKCTLVLEDKKVSREHAKLERADGVWTIADCKSGNGTRVNGGKVEAHVLALQDIIRIGDAELVVTVRPRAGGETQREARHGFRRGMQCAIADHGRKPEVALHDRRKAHVDAERSQLGGHEPTERCGGLQCGRRILVVEVAERAHRWQPKEPVAKSLHPPAFVVDGHEQRRLTHRVDLRYEPLERGAIRVVAAEEDHAADQRGREPAALLGIERRAFDIDHQRTERHA